MIKEIIIENIILKLSDEANNVRVQSDEENTILTNQNIDAVIVLIKQNFIVVSNYYKVIINNATQTLAFEDINRVSILILMHYLYMYNSWRSMYKNQGNRDLKFNEKDFNNPSTHDLLFKYFKTKYPNNWEKKCAVLLRMDLNELKTYYKTRLDFYNK